VTGRVWLVDFDAYGPEPGDYVGRRSVHATVDGAAARLAEYLDLVGVTESADVLAHVANAEGDSFSADLETDDGVKVSYGCHSMPVED
jgi:hypothetical protein